MKQFLILNSLVGIIMIGVGGCMFGNASDKMVSYINKKYGEDFEYVSAYGGYLGSKSKSILVKTDKFPGDTILVDQKKDENGKNVYSDNYTAYLLRDELREKLTNLASEVYGSGNTKVFYDVYNIQLPSKFDENTTLEELTSCGYAVINVNIYVSSSVDVNRKDSDLETLRSLLEQNKILSDGTIYYVKDIATLDEVDYSNYSSMKEKSDLFTTIGDFIIDKSYQLIRNEWR